MRNEYKINKKVMMSWAKEYHINGTSNVILFILWVIVGVCSVTTLVLLSFNGGDWIDWYVSALLLLVSVFKLFFQRFAVISHRYKLLSKTYGVSEWTRSVEFNDEEIVLSDHTSVSKYRYENIKWIKEKGNAVLILFHNNLGVRIYKDAFVEGSWDACKEKLESMRQ